MTDSQTISPNGVTLVLICDSSRHGHNYLSDPLEFYQEVDGVLFSFSYGRAYYQGNEPTLVIQTVAETNASCGGLSDQKSFDELKAAGELPPELESLAVEILKAAKGNNVATNHSNGMYFLEDYGGRYGHGSHYGSQWYRDTQTGAVSPANVVFGLPLRPNWNIEFRVTLGSKEKRGTHKVRPTLKGRLTAISDTEVTIAVPTPGGTETFTLDATDREGTTQYGNRTYKWEMTRAWVMSHILSNCIIPEDLRLKVLVEMMVAHGGEDFDEKGIKKILPRLKEIAAADPYAARILPALSSSKSKDKIIRNRLLKEFVEAVGDDTALAVEKLKEAALEFRKKGEHYYYSMELNHVASALPGAAQRLDAEEKKRDWKKRDKASDRAEGLGITAESYPLLRAAIENGDISTNVFVQPKVSGTHQPVNREFDVWEEALSMEGWAEVIYSVAQNAAGRTTYERDITPWLLFMLYKLPAYLDRHAPLSRGRKWSCMPSHVDAAWKLEMEEPEEGEQTVKRRSALTPVADNAKGIVTVPYAALSVGGARTQWCYSRHYYLFERGFTDPESGGMVTKDLEVALNGRDDYGLMYYDLNGTATATGYPTFLIIFERRSRSTFVHFHRVRPCRSKNGIKTPANGLIRACYKYMAGNIDASEISAQQGDLIFIHHPNDPVAAGAKVEEPEESGALVFESHEMHSRSKKAGLSLYRSLAKTPKNRLGFLYAPGGINLKHPEHPNHPRMKKGWYEIRRCKSWEANPSAIMSLTID